MGNKITRRCSVVVDERYTRPQGLYPQRDVDQKKLRRLILDSKLAPCFPGEDEPSADYEECPICFLCYPSLNRSKCCSKGVCTECYLQMKSPRAVRATQCPFCKSHNYAVEFRGVKSLEEKTMEAAEEQKVIEAKIRMRKQELLDDEEQEQRQKEKQRQEEANALPVTPAVKVPSPVVAVELPESCSHDKPIEIPQQETETSDSSCDDLESSQVQGASGSEESSVSSNPAPQQQALVTTLPPTESHIQLRPAPYARHRDEEFDFDLEDIMVMEAIWQSIQEQGTCHSYTTLCEAAASNQLSASAIPDAAATPSPEANRVYQHRRSGIMAGGLASAIAALAERHATKGEPLALKSLQNRAPSEVATSSASVILPQSFEDQMMFAMALSITDAQSRARLEDNHPRPLPNPLPNVS